MILDQTPESRKGLNQKSRGAVAGGETDDELKRWWQFVVDLLQWPWIRRLVAGQRREKIRTTSGVTRQMPCTVVGGGGAPISARARGGHGRRVEKRRDRMEELDSTSGHGSCDGS